MSDDNTFDRPARNSDPETSDIAGKGNATKESQCAALLKVWREYPDGLTDNEAAERAELSLYGGSCWWHRASDLRQFGYIRWATDHSGEYIKRAGDHGRPRRVSVITSVGMDQNWPPMTVAGEFE